MDAKRYLLGKGVRPNLKGFDYLLCAIELCKDKMYIRNVTKMLYPKIAEINNETASKVERAIRHAIYQSDVKMCNSEFIARALIDLEN